MTIIRSGLASTRIVTKKGRLPAGLTRLSELCGRQQTGLATGYENLSTRLPGGGWPLGALTELLCSAEGFGELRLLMPALAQLTARGKWVVWVSPPYVPYAPALIHHGVDLPWTLAVQAPGSDESLWAAEQILRSPAAGAVLLWSSTVLQERRLRRLQLAAETGGCAGFLFRTGASAGRASPSALRLRLEPGSNHTWVEILKCRGGHPGERFRVEHHEQA